MNVLESSADFLVQRSTAIGGSSHSNSWLPAARRGREGRHLGCLAGGGDLESLAWRVLRLETGAWHVPWPLVNSKLAPGTGVRVKVEGWRLELGSWAAGRLVEPSM